MNRRKRALLTTTAAVTLIGLAIPAVATEPAAKPLGEARGVRYEMTAPPPAADKLLAPVAALSAVSCDDGWTAVSGGQTAAPHPTGGISDAAPGDDNSLWFATAWQRPDLPIKLKTFAVCMQDPEVATATLTKQNLPADSAVYETVYCNGTGSAVGGGAVQLGTHAEFRINSSFPVDSPADVDTLPDDGWRTYLDYSGAGGDGATFKVSCLDAEELVYRSTTVAVPPGSPVSAKAVCPKRSPAVGGGVFVSGASDRAHLTASRPWDGADKGSVPEDGWRGAVYNTSDAGLSMTVHAVCRTIQVF
jgi:hypothetical protein